MPKFPPLLAALLALVLPSLAQAETDYPSRAVKIIVSAPPGGGLDIAARVVADRLAKLWGQPFVVENRPGAGGNLGTEAVAAAEPDGYTLLSAQPAPLTTNVVLYKKLNFDPAAFEPLAIMTTIPNTLVVRADFPANSVAELIAYARANRQGQFRIAGRGHDAPPHRRAVRARDRREAHPRALSRHRAGRERPRRRPPRSPLLPARSGARAIPGEEGEDAGGDDRGARRLGARGADHGRGRRQRLSLRHLERAAAPPKTPAPIVAKLNAAINAVLKSPETAEHLRAMNMTPVGGTPDAIKAFIKEESERWGEVIRAAGIRVD